MKSLRILAKRRFNYVDVLGGYLAGHQLLTGNWLGTVLLLVSTALISAVLEALAARAERRAT